MIDDEQPTYTRLDGEEGKTKEAFKQGLCADARRNGSRRHPLASNAPEGSSPTAYQPVSRHPYWAKYLGPSSLYRLLACLPALAFGVEKVG
jgi:hypothetical protein